MAYRIGCTDSVCKPPEGAAIKSHGAERSGKRCPQGHQVSAKKLNESEPIEDMSKQHLVVKSTDFQQLVRELWRASVYWPQSNRH